MYQKVFEGDKFSYFHDRETDEYMLYWRKYDIDIRLKGDDASIFRQQLELITSQPEAAAKAQIEKAIGIHFYFKYACPTPHFAEV